MRGWEILPLHTTRKCGSTNSASGFSREGGTYSDQQDHAIEFVSIDAFTNPQPFGLSPRQLRSGQRPSEQLRHAVPASGAIGSTTRTVLVATL